MADFKKQNNRVNSKFNRKDFTKKETRRKLNVNEIKERFNSHIVNLALIVKNNAEIRRFTAIGIINHLKREGIINGEHNHISFKWNKFAVTSDGLVNEYKYSELFFINSLIASFTSFSASAQQIIDTFCKIEFNECEGINDVVTNETIEEIVLSNETYIASKMNEITTDEVMNNEDNSSK